MHKKIILFILAALVIYVAGFYSATDKYHALLKTNTCGVVRVVSHDWQKYIFSLGHKVEKMILGQAEGATTMHVETENGELREYFSNQLCNTSNGKEIGS